MDLQGAGFQLERGRHVDPIRETASKSVGIGVAQAERGSLRARSSRYGKETAATTVEPILVCRAGWIVDQDRRVGHQRRTDRRRHVAAGQYQHEMRFVMTVASDFLFWRIRAQQMETEICGLPPRRAATPEIRSAPSDNHPSDMHHL